MLQHWIQKNWKNDKEVLARMYRNRFEDSQVEKTRTEIVAKIKQQEKHQFYTPFTQTT